MKYNQDDEISIYEILLKLWKKKILIFSITSLSSLISVLFALSLPNIYKSEAILAPSTANSSLSNQFSSYSSIASYAGISLPSGELSQSQEAIKRIKSFDFFKDYFLPYINLENLMAVDEWDPNNNKIKYNSNIFNNNKNEWTLDPKLNSSNIPSSQEAYREYKNIIDISHDSVTTFVNLSIKHKSPYIAKKWLDIVINNINLSMQNEEKILAENSIKYLNQYYENTNFQSLKDAISNLQESQMQNLMLASSTKFYVFKIIDSPIAPEMKSEPNRSVISILGTFIGFFIAIIIIFTLDYFNRAKRM